MEDLGHRKNKNILLVKNERDTLKAELEKIFIDSNGSVYNGYSLADIERKYPTIKQLYSLL